MNRAALEVGLGVAIEAARTDILGPIGIVNAPTHVVADQLFTVAEGWRLQGAAR